MLRQLPLSNNSNGWTSNLMEWMAHGWVVKHSYCDRFRPHRCRLHLRRGRPQKVVPVPGAAVLVLVAAVSCKAVPGPVVSVSTMAVPVAAVAIPAAAFLVAGTATAAKAAVAKRPT